MRLSHKIPVTPWRAATPWTIRPRMALPLIIGLSLFGLGEGLLVQAQWGATPWTVFAQGVAKHTHWSLGWSTAVISLAVLVAWFPFSERPGFGTIANLIIIAYVLDLVSTNLVVPHAYWLKSFYMVGAVVVIGIGSALSDDRTRTRSPRWAHDEFASALGRQRGLHPPHTGGDGTRRWMVDGGNRRRGNGFLCGTIGFSIGASLRATESLVSWFSS